MAVELRVANPLDRDLLLELMREFYEDAGYAFEPAGVARTLDELLADPALGRAWLVLEDGATAGYAVVTHGFSLEYKGRDAFVDELFVRPSRRGRGLGTEALAHLERHCREQGIQALHLEVEVANEAAQALYRARGFEGKERRILTKRLAPERLGY